MKLFSLSLLIIGCLIATTSYSQAPQGIPYQAVARNSSGAILASTAVSVRFTIRDSIVTGTIKYKETFSVTTTAQGMFSVNVGQGTPVTGTFASVNWGTNAKFLQVEIDPFGGASYIDMGTTQMMSVPYALYAGSISSNSVPQLHVLVYTVSGTFTTPSNTTSSTVFKIVITGGGGAGGRNAGGGSGHGGAGGSAGATAIYYASGLAPSTTCSIVIGIGGQNLYGEADAGGNSSITIGSTTIFAGGGGGGGIGTSGTGGAPGLPTLGGTASNGTINIAGGDGSPGDGSDLRLITGGTGGSSFWGGGGRQACNAIAFGAGGGGGGYLGGCTVSSDGTGNGASGVCTIEWMQ